ncbi:MAG TPA: hypothetical protein GXX14_05950 [Clostridiaceae bacterium]|nr:hypothetical protein [Clostridiaceae bacterium]
MYKTVLYKKAYRMLDNITPLKFDCGTLCESRCCKGDDSTGMHLYPGEEIMQNSNNFLKIRDAFFESGVIKFATCNEKCDRRTRPLACRIFPLVPYISQDGRLHIVEDPRAKHICPLLLHNDMIRMNRRFKSNVYKVFRFLIEDREIKEYVCRLSNILREYALFTGTSLP